MFWQKCVALNVDKKNSLDFDFKIRLLPNEKLFLKDLVSTYHNGNQHNTRTDFEKIKSVFKSSVDSNYK